MSTADDAVERLGRGLAARLTRRSFIDRIAKVGILVAGGPALASLLVDRAEARVCGQSGVSPKCSTFDCNGTGDVWGWCWYASPGCCSGGGLKKICDCCRLNHPNVHGYCPSGHNVRCIVESCLHDPRVMKVPVERLDGFTAEGLALARSRARGNGSAPVVVVADEEILAASIGATAAAAADAPLLLTPADRASGAVVDEVRRLGAGRVLLVGPNLSPAVDAELARVAIVERLHGPGGIEAASIEVGRWVMARTGARRGWAVAAAGTSAVAAPAAAAAAASRRGPLAVGFDAARALATGPGSLGVTYLAGELADRAGELPGAFAVRGDGIAPLSAAISAVVAGAERTGGLSVTLVPAAMAGAAPGAIPGHGVLLYHPDGALGLDAWLWSLAHRERAARGVVAGSFGTLDDGGIYDLQSALNGFDTHRLIGVPGQGLPVISQPASERELGRARVAGEPEQSQQLQGGYWISRANPDRTSS